MNIHEAAQPQPSIHSPFCQLLLNIFQWTSTLYSNFFFSPPFHSSSLLCYLLIHLNRQSVLEKREKKCRERKKNRCAGARVYFLPYLLGRQPLQWFSDLIKSHWMLNSPFMARTRSLSKAFKELVGIPFWIFITHSNAITRIQSCKKYAYFIISGVNELAFKWVLHCEIKRNITKHLDAMISIC